MNYVTIICWGYYQILNIGVSISGKTSTYKDREYTSDRAKANMFNMEYPTVSGHKRDKQSKRAAQ